MAPECLSDSRPAHVDPVKEAKKRWKRKYYTKPTPRQPQITALGLVIAPEPAKIDGRPPTKWQRDRMFLDSHHLHFPKRSFAEHSQLATDFREHRFNQVKLPRFQHERLHSRYRDFIDRHPSYLLPDEEVMMGFMAEARLLDLLDVCVKASDMLDRAVAAGGVDLNKAVEEKASRFETIESVLAVTGTFEIIHSTHVKETVERVSASIGTLTTNAA